MDNNEKILLATSDLSNTEKYKKDLSVLHDGFCNRTVD